VFEAGYAQCRRAYREHGRLTSTLKERYHITLDGSDGASVRKRQEGTLSKGSGTPYGEPFTGSEASPQIGNVSPVL
jgi:hypothetical protein